MSKEMTGLIPSFFREMKTENSDLFLDYIFKNDIQLVQISLTFFGRNHNGIWLFFYRISGFYLQPVNS